MSLHGIQGWSICTLKPGAKATLQAKEAVGRRLNRATQSRGPDCKHNSVHVHQSTGRDVDLVPQYSLAGSNMLGKGSEMPGRVRASVVRGRGKGWNGVVRKLLSPRRQLRPCNINAAAFPKAKRSNTILYEEAPRRAMSGWQRKTVAKAKFALYSHSRPVKGLAAEPEADLLPARLRAATELRVAVLVSILTMVLVRRREGGLLRSRE